MPLWTPPPKGRFLVPPLDCPQVSAGLDRAPFSDSHDCHPAGPEGALRSVPRCAHCRHGTDSGLVPSVLPQGRSTKGLVWEHETPPPLGLPKVPLCEHRPFPFQLTPGVPAPPLCHFPPCVIRPGGGGGRASPCQPKKYLWAGGLDIIVLCHCCCCPSPLHTVACHFERFPLPWHWIAQPCFLPGQMRFSSAQRGSVLWQRSPGSVGMHINASFMRVTARRWCTTVHLVMAPHCPMSSKPPAKRAKPPPKGSAPSKAFLCTVLTTCRSSR